MQPHYRALGLTLGALAISVGSVGVASFVAWTRCDGDQCSARLAISVVGIAPVSLLVCTMLLLLRVRSPLGRVSRGLTAASVGVASLPLTFFVLGDPLVVAGSAALLAVLIFFVLTPETAAADVQADGAAEEFRLPAVTPTVRVFAANTDRGGRADPSAQQRLDALAEMAAALVARTSRLKLERTAEPRQSVNGYRPSAAGASSAPHRQFEESMRAPSRNGHKTPVMPRGPTAHS